MRSSLKEIAILAALTLQNFNSTELR